MLKLDIVPLYNNRFPKRFCNDLMELDVKPSPRFAYVVIVVSL